jgi:hypothetical protein
MLGMGFSAVSGLLGAAGAQTKAQGDQLNIQGQMLQTVGQAYQMDVQAAEYATRANMSDYQAGVAKMNQQIALQQADYARSVGEVEAEESGMKTRAEVGMTKATQAASGLNVNTGSAVDVRSSMVELGAFDQNTIRANAAKVAWGYDIEATQDEAQSSLYTMTAATQRMAATAATTGAQMTRAALPLEERAYGLAGKAGDISTFGSIVNAGSSVASKWLAGSEKGLW